MANISQFLTAIKEAIYGEDVRDAIHDAIEAINDEAITTDEQRKNNDMVLRPYFDATTPSTITPQFIQDYNGYYDWKTNNMNKIENSKWANVSIFLWGMKSANTGRWYYLRTYGDNESNVPLLIQSVSENEYIEFGAGYGYFSCYLKSCYDSELDAVYYELYSTLSTDENYRIYGDVYTRTDAQSPWIKNGTDYKIYPDDLKYTKINLLNNKQMDICRAHTLKEQIEELVVELSTQSSN